MIYSSVGGSPDISLSPNDAGNRSIPRAHRRPQPFPQMSHELRIALRRKTGCASSAACSTSARPLIHQELSGHGPRRRFAVNGFPGTLLLQQQRVDRDYAACRRMSFDIGRRDVTGGTPRLSLRQQPDRLLRFGRNPAGPPFNGEAARAPASAGGVTPPTGQILRDNPGGTLLPAESTVRPAPISPISSAASSSPRTRTATASPIASI